jgi:hypothetical protein
LNIAEKPGTILKAVFGFFIVVFSQEVEIVAETGTIKNETGLT